MRNFFRLLPVIVILVQLAMILHMASMVRHAATVVAETRKSERSLRVSLRDTCDFIARQQLTEEYWQEVSEGRIRVYEE